MSSRKYAALASGIFLVIAVLQFARAALAWPVTVETAWGTLSIPFWPNWVACVVFALLAWLGFAASRE